MIKFFSRLFSKKKKLKAQDDITWDRYKLIDTVNWWLSKPRGVSLSHLSKLAKTPADLWLISEYLLVYLDKDYIIKNKYNNYIFRHKCKNQ